MHILIATSGALPAAPAVDFAVRMLRDGGDVTVTTVIEVPRTFLEELRSDAWHPLEDTDPGRPWTAKEDALIERYVEERGRRLTEPIAQGLRAAGIPSQARYLEGEDPVKSISALADELDADLIILGATRKIFDHAAWGSVSAQLMAESKRPVLVLPAATLEAVVAGEPSD
jgi:nucleotide-binding universal stress UspA family protein